MTSQSVSCPMEGWKKVCNSNGVPFYVNHHLRETSWHHPKLLILLNCSEEFAYIKYAAYRMALKCRHVQSGLFLHSVDLITVKGSLAATGLNQWSSYEMLVSCKTIRELAKWIYRGQPNVSCDAEDMLVNFVLNVLDRPRSGHIRLALLKLLLAVMCSGRLLDRYKYIYQELADFSGRLSARNLTDLLFVTASVSELLGEPEAFGPHLIAGSVRTCARQCGGSELYGFSEEAVFVWIMQEPQLLVWLSTLYRWNASRGVAHSVGCSICQVKPVQGLCYACLQCLGYYLCDECFLLGRTSKNHKLQHPLQEFCLQWSKKQKTRSVLKSLWNKLIGKKMSTKPSSLPPSQSIAQLDTYPSMVVAEAKTSDEKEDAPVSSGSSSSDPDEEEEDDLMSRTILDGTVSADPRFDSILGHLESENQQLTEELDQLKRFLPDDQPVLTTCTNEIQQQLRRLRALLRKRHLPSRAVTPPPQLPSVPYEHVRRGAPPFHSTPMPTHVATAHSISPIAALHPPLSATTPGHFPISRSSCPTTPDLLTFSLRRPSLTEYSLSDLCPPAPALAEADLDGAASEEALPQDPPSEKRGSPLAEDDVGWILKPSPIVELAASLAMPSEDTQRALKPLHDLVHRPADQWHDAVEEDAEQQQHCPSRIAQELANLLQDLRSFCLANGVAEDAVNGALPEEN